MFIEYLNYSAIIDHGGQQDFFDLQLLSAGAGTVRDYGPPMPTSTVHYCAGLNGLII